MDIAQIVFDVGLFVGFKNVGVIDENMFDLLFAEAVFSGDLLDILEYQIVKTDRLDFECDALQIGHMITFELYCDCPMAIFPAGIRRKEESFSFTGRERSAARVRSLLRYHRRKRDSRPAGRYRSTP